MPKSKPRKKDSSSDSDSGPDDRLPVKKSKPAPAPAEKSGGGGSGDGELSWDLGKNRFLKLSEFKGKWYVNIREFYLSDGELKPGKKGIMLTMEQFQKFKSVLPDLEEAIKTHV